MKTVALLIISTLSYVLDVSEGNCPSATVALSLIHFGHHVFSNYLWFGSIMGFDPATHFVVASITLTGWFMFGWKCFITMYYNQNCNNPVERHHNDIMYRVTGMIGREKVPYSMIIASILTLDTVLMNKN